MTHFIDYELARNTFLYDKETGVLSLKIERGRHNRFKEGSAVGVIHYRGAKGYEKPYLRTRFNDAQVYVHRIIWVLMTKEQPKEVDHIDGNGLNNRWENLRNVSHSLNGKNQKKHSTNTSGKGGVTYRKDSGKWRARIIVDGKSISLGTFTEKEDAIEARKKAEIKHGFIGE